MWSSHASGSYWGFRGGTEYGPLQENCNTRCAIRGGKGVRPEWHCPGCCAQRGRPVCPLSSQCASSLLLQFFWNAHMPRHMPPECKSLAAATTALVLIFAGSLAVGAETSASTGDCRTRFDRQFRRRISAGGGRCAGRDEGQVPRHRSRCGRGRPVRPGEPGTSEAGTSPACHVRAPMR